MIFRLAVGGFADPTLSASSHQKSAPGRELRRERCKNTVAVFLFFVKKSEASRDASRAGGLEKRGFTATPLYMVEARAVVRIHGL